ncbi:MAG: AAA family ATPase [Microthrixaceae bacterium]
MSTTTATVMLCHVDNSNSARVELDDSADDVPSADHPLSIDQVRRLSEVIERNAGRLQESRGGALMALFPSASGAIIAAAGLHCSVKQHFPEFRVRIGLAAGDVTDDGDGCSGLPVATASRLGAWAHAGQTVVDQAVRWLGAEHSKATFERLDPFVGDGLGEPIEAFAVPWNGPERPSTERPTFPPVLATASEFGFVGRSVEWEALEEIWRRAASGMTQTALLSGEAGVGKTRLAAEFARSRSEHGAAVLFGSCDAHPVVLHQPWVEALDQLLLVAHPDELVTKTAAALAALGGLATANGSPDHNISQTSRTTPSAAVAALQVAAVREVLAESATRWPLLVVIEDLQWASVQTLGLLARLSREGRLGPIMIIATLRDTSDKVTDDFATVLAELGGSPSVSRLRINRLGADEVASLIASVTAEKPGPALRRIAEIITEYSGGNVFLVCELWRRALEAGVVRRAGGRWHVEGKLDEIPVPSSVTEVLADRIDRLPSPVRHVADLLAISGHVVDLQVLNHAAHLASTDLARILEQLVSADLVQVVTRPRLSYKFTHPLVRAAVEARVPLESRAQLHLQIADGLVCVRDSDDGPVLAQVADHYAAAASLGVAGGGRPGDTSGSLSSRELQVLRLAAEGCSNGDIGRRLAISGNTAANHMRSILRKTCTANRAEAATYAARHGLLEE